MDDQQLVDRLLKRLESEDLDFKSGKYNLSKAYLQAKFIKDIVAMANTPNRLRKNGSQSGVGSALGA